MISIARPKPQPTKPRCPVCGYRIRSKGHTKGDHHKRRRKGGR